MQHFVLLHTNDIHGRIEGLARIATMVKQIRSENVDRHVLYVDAGDVEENSTRLSNLTKGVAMHRLLSAAGCDVAVVGNGGVLRYGYQILQEYSQIAAYPLLLANLYTSAGQLVPGVQATLVKKVGNLKLGLIGVTADLDGAYTSLGLSTPPVLPIIKACASQLYQEGANVVILLSHLGLDTDRVIAADLQQDVSLIIGAHSHHLLSDGEWIGRVLLVQAGDYARYLGRLNLAWDGSKLIINSISVLPVTSAIPSAPEVLQELDSIESDMALLLATTLGELTEALDFASDRECGTANLMADMLRTRMQADVAIVTSGCSFNGPLPAGPLQRLTLWNSCTSSANPGVVTMTGAQLEATIRRGLDPVLARDCPRPLRGTPRGLLHLSGASIRHGQLLIHDQPVDADHLYRVAGSDWELDVYGGYVDALWKLQPAYDTPTILREALEEYLLAHRTISVTMGRLA